MTGRETRRSRRTRDEDAPRGRKARRAGVLVLVFVAVFIAIRSGQQSGPGKRESDGPQNVLLITLGATRADQLGCYGAEPGRTVFVDGLADEGVTFARCVTSAPITLPAHASLQTGMYPYAHGVRTDGIGRLAGSLETLAESLRAAGLATHAVVGGFALNERFGLAQGFDAYDDVDPPLEDERLCAVRKGDAVCDAALAALGKLASEPPFFLWVHFHDPFAACVAQQADTDARAAYAKALGFVDEQVGRLLASLNELDVADETLVVLVADHGTSLGSHGEQRHGFSLYDPVIRVPLILRHPATIPAGESIAAQVRTIDILPTICDLLNVETPADVQGVSLVPLATGVKEDLSLAAYSETLRPQIEFGLSPLRAWTDRGCKYILAPHPELYELGGDPGEVTNIATERAELAAEMRAALRQLIEDAPAPPGKEDASATLDADELAQLQSLGYVGAASDDDEEVVTELERFEPRGADPKDHRGEIASVVVELPKLLGEKDYKRAESLLRRVLESLPNAPHVQVQLGLVLAAQGRMDEAAAAFDAAAALGGDDPYVRRAYATFLGEAGRHREAIDAFRIVLQDVPNDVASLRAAAMSHVALGEHAEAQALLEVARKVDPRDARVLCELGRVHALQEQRAAAIDCFSEALSIHPGFSECRTDLQRVRDEAGKSDQR